MQRVSGEVSSTPACGAWRSWMATRKWRTWRAQPPGAGPRALHQPEIRCLRYLLGHE
jgi:hypothetical protein